ncbi:hypothetical protein ACFQ9J_13665 [Streptomyces sp. NPDC056529]|uniref:hypothetical protein n=1 Tax=Streptomyces sp. NPDC056529 TaxID=3345855 RepID=UPI00368B22A7
MRYTPKAVIPSGVLYDPAFDEDPADVHVRRRQEGQLEHINAYYRLPERLGVTVALGGRVRHEDREGTITDTAGQYLRVLLNGDTDTTVRHATASLAYQHPDSTWVEATPLPDLYARTAHKAGQ